TPLSPTVGAVVGGGEGMTPGTTRNTATTISTRVGDGVVVERERGVDDQSLGKRSRGDERDENVKVENGMVHEGEKDDRPDVQKEEALKANGTHLAEEEARAAKRQRMDGDAAAAASSAELTQAKQNGASAAEDEGSEEGEVEE
ncbi:hypothetical protein LTS18_012448, partial [Coniosporium uncinatum]